MPFSLVSMLADFRRSQSVSRRSPNARVAFSPTPTFEVDSHVRMNCSTTPFIIESIAVSPGVRAAFAMIVMARILADGAGD